MRSEDERIRSLLARVETIAVVGLSSNPSRPSHGVARAMQGYGYRIVPVNPNETEILGEPGVPDLDSLPGDIDLVDVFRAPEHVAAIVEDCIRLGLPTLWLQEGVIDREAAQRAEAAGIEVVMDRCMYKDYRRLM